MPENHTGKHTGAHSCMHTLQGERSRGDHIHRETWKWNPLSHVWLFVRPWTYSPWNSPGQNTGVGSLSLLQGIFPTQELNQGLLHCRQILYQLSYQGSPYRNMVSSKISQQTTRAYHGWERRQMGKGVLFCFYNLGLIFTEDHTLRFLS